MFCFAHELSPLRWQRSARKHGGWSLLHRTNPGQEMQGPEPTEAPSLVTRPLGSEKWRVAWMELEGRHQRPECGDCCLVSYMFGVSWRPSAAARLYPRDGPWPWLSHTRSVSKHPVSPTAPGLHRSHCFFQEQTWLYKTVSSLPPNIEKLLSVHKPITWKRAQVFHTATSKIKPRKDRAGVLVRPVPPPPPRAPGGPCPIFLRGFSGAGPGGTRRH